MLVEQLATLVEQWAMLVEQLAMLMEQLAMLVEQWAMLVAHAVGSVCPSPLDLRFGFGDCKLKLDNKETFAIQPLLI